MTWMRKGGNIETWKPCPYLRQKLYLGINEVVTRDLACVQLQPLSACEDSNLRGGGAEALHKNNTETTHISVAEFNSEIRHSG